MTEILVVFLPLIAFVIVGLAGNSMRDDTGQWITCGAMAISAFLSLIVFADVAFGDGERVVHLMTWFNSGAFKAEWALKLDTLTAVMLVVVTVVSAMVHIYSIGYMAHDPCKRRFMSYLSLFTFMMLMLVTSNNLIQTFFGWEGVGVASYLLIGFWNHKPSACSAAIKAFVVNRVGDFGLALGIAAVFMLTGSVEFDAIFAAVPEVAGTTFNFLGMEVDALTVTCLLLFMGAMGKSAQLGLHTWLPDAMEGPTPVSALIHAATMVTAGVFLIARLSPVFEYAPVALEVITIVGALTACVAATIGLTQFDIKRVIAYSTMSQLGYMFFALGVHAYSAAIFHLMTHAFFKALLFLGAGSVIHAVSDEQDMRKMGGLWSHIKVTYAMMWIGSLALAGLPFFAGYYSKDLILEAAWASGSEFGEFAFWLGVAAAFMTAFYSWRLLFMTFHGAPRADEYVMAHVHESPPIMTLPLAILAVGAVFAGVIGWDWFAGDGRTDFWGHALLVLEGNDSIEAAHHVPSWVKILPIGVALFGIVCAWLFYIRMPSLPARTAKALPVLHTLLSRKWFFDEIYDAVFTRTARLFGHFMWKKGDDGVIDGLGPHGMANIAQWFARLAGQFQNGFIYHYAFIMIIGATGFLTWFLARFLVTPV